MILSIDHLPLASTNLKVKWMAEISLVATGTYEKSTLDFPLNKYKRG
jgi:hypothetical protein